MTFVETFSPFLLYNLPWEDKDKRIQSMFERQWGNLRRAVLFCLRHHQGQHTPANLQNARHHFEQYAFAVQEVRLCASACARA